MLIGNHTRRVAVIGGMRSPFAKAHGAYALETNQSLLTAVLRALVDRYQLQGLELGEVVAGAVL